MGSPTSLGRCLSTCCRKSALTKVVNKVSDAVVVLGPIEFLKDPDVTEVTTANGPTKASGSFVGTPEADRFGGNP